MNQNEAMTRDHEILSVREDIVEQTTVQVCIEDTITITLNGIPVTTLKITPVDLESFAVGFLICEGLVSDPGCISAIDVRPTLISVTAEECTLEGSLPSLEIRSAGVGIGRRQELSSPALGDGFTVDKKILFEGTRQVHETATVWRSTGGTHCTILVDNRGHILSAAEDIGRHTSVDKAVGK
ncbi:MAG TPA: formate dehydrogenase accessory sulfurtransferase FdhD, partial [Methanoregulaceae archaeon]|nr:formate dehydrogenase accessory sulfurtransferase FdhD [Methanoregulaceae archaeon]